MSIAVVSVTNTYTSTPPVVSHISHGVETVVIDIIIVIMIRNGVMYHWCNDLTVKEMYVLPQEDAVWYSRLFNPSTFRSDSP